MRGPDWIMVCEHNPGKIITIGYSILTQHCKSPSKADRACRYRWFDSWDWLVNTALRAAGSPDVVAGAGEVAIDPHIHTMWSRCSISSPERILLRAVALGLRGVGVLDHNDPRGIGETERCADVLRAKGLIPEDFLIIPGVEISTSSGHMGALFVRESLPGELSPAETVRIIHEAGGLAVAVHPYHSTGIGDVLFDIPVDAVEVYSGSVFSPEQAGSSAALLDDPRLANVAKLGSSDAHYVRGIGSCYSVFSRKELTMDAVRAAIVEGRVAARQSSHYLKVQRLLSRVPKLH